jgi:hypothetical protein
VDEKFFDLHFNANVKRFFFSVEKGPAFTKDRASIILNASIAATKGFPGISVYSATKPPFGHSRELRLSIRFSPNSSMVGTAGRL